MRDGGDRSAPASIVLEEGALLARKYRLNRTAGFGGMAQLWVATNEATGAEVCIKILVPDKVDDDSVQRFRREAYAAARLSHRAIVRIFDLVELDATGEDTTKTPVALGIVMELLRGETLGDHLMKKGKLSLDESIDLALPILSALAHAHRAGIVHRDLKPDNIFLATDPDGHVIPKVLDFGVSKIAPTEQGGRASAPLTLDGVMLGTPSYMSPEQARGARNIDARSDVFSVSILIYMLLSGRNPFESESFHSVMSAILERDPPRLDAVPDAIWAVLEKGLAKDPSARYADATELGISLRRACGRSAGTESGVHAVALVPASARTIVTPLGGDSHVSVPPVGSAGDTGSNASPPSTMSPAGRRRAVRIVAAVVAASAALGMVALLRGPSGGSTSASPPATGELPPSASAAGRTGVAPTATALVAPPTEAPKVAATAGATAAADGRLIAGGAAADAGVATGPGAAGTAAVRSVKKAAASAPPSAAPSPDGFTEPALAKDPGF